MISIVLNVFSGVLLVIGLGLLTIALYGTLRMPNTYSQLHAQGLATGPGVVAVLAASLATENVEIITFALLTIVFVVVTSPVSSHAIARAAYRRGRRRQRHREHGRSAEDEQ